MAKWNPSKYGWDKIWQVGQPELKLPDELTKNWWDSKKSLVAKLTKATGVGAAITNVGTAWNAAKKYFPTLGIPFSVTALDVMTKQYLGYVTSGEVKTLRTNLMALRDLAKQQAAECRNSKIIPKGTAEALEDIQDNADKLMVATNDNSLKGYLQSAIKKFTETKLAEARKNAGMFITGAKSVVTKWPGQIQDARSKATDQGCQDIKVRQYVADRMQRGTARDMTTPLGNLMKAVTAGVGIDNFNAQTAKQLYDEISTVSNLPSAPTLNNKQECDALINKVAAWGPRYNNVVQNIALKALPTVQ